MSDFHYWLDCRETFGLFFTDKHLCAALLYSGKNVSTGLNFRINSGSYVQAPGTSPLVEPLHRPVAIRGAHLSKPRSYSFFLLAVLTISVVIFWTPSLWYIFFQHFMGFSSPVFEKVSMAMFNAQSVMDPVVFLLTVKPLRVAVTSTSCGRK